MKWILGTMIAATAAFSAAQDIPLPEGQGKEVVQKTCTVCHSAERIVRERLDSDGWKTVLGAMMDEGADIDPADYDVLLKYLVKSFGPDTPAPKQ